MCCELIVFVSHSIEEKLDGVGDRWPLGVEKKRCSPWRRVISFVEILVVKNIVRECCVRLLVLKERSRVRKRVSDREDGKEKR